MTDPNHKLRITRLHLSNFKGFTNFSLSLDPMTMLVGPNNAGKSSIIGVFRALSVALRTARARRPQLLRSGDVDRWGYHIPEDAIPISLENAQYNYSDTDAVATFTFSNQRVLRLVFSQETGCQLVVEPDGPMIRTVSNFKRFFPIEIGVVPILGPFEHEEQLVEEKTVRRNLQTHRASRNFRNYWYQIGIDEFEEFRQAVRESWDGIDIQRPQLSPNRDGEYFLHMMCTEDRITRELYWMGFGFHIWLQIMTHVLRDREATLLVIDEPETYMHPALQRHLLNVLRDAGPDCLLATHSSELVAEADRDEVVLVDKAKRSGKRLRSNAHVSALDALGSRFNFALTDVLRQHAAILVEGESDLKYLKLLGSRLSPKKLQGSRIPPLIPLGGHRPDEAADFARAMRTLVGSDVRVAVVLDRDYRSDEEVEEIESVLQKTFTIAHVLRRKEIENYFITPGVVSKALRARRNGSGQDSSFDGVTLLESATDGLRDDAESQCVAKFVDYGSKARRSLDLSTLNKEALSRFRRRWSTIAGRLDIVSGKHVLREVNSALQASGERALTVPQLARQMKEADIPREVVTLLRQLDRLTAV